MRFFDSWHSTAAYDVVVSVRAASVIPVCVGFVCARAERIYLDQLSGRFSSIGYLFIAELPERAAGDIYCLLNSGFYGGWEKRDGATLEKELLFLARGRVCAKRVYC